MTPLIAGNWKMNGLHPATAEVSAVAAGLAAAPARGEVEVLICPPATLMFPVRDAAAGTAVVLGGQNCHSERQGAFTGEVSAEMLADAGAKYCIVGHSERRETCSERNVEISAKADACHRAGITPIVCVGETRWERNAGKAVQAVAAMLAASLPEESTGPLVVAYEPIWAVGTGVVPSTGEIAEVHAALKALAGPGVRVLYGGSVKPENAAEILATPGVDGALIGGASLKAEDFLGIIAAAR